MVKITLYVTQDFEQVWNEFKKICDRENDTRSSKIRSMVARYVAVHAKGNPQLLLEKFVGDVQSKCYRCEAMFPALTQIEFISGLRAGLCGTCLEQEQAKGPYCTIKKVAGKRWKRGT